MAIGTKRSDANKDASHDELGMCKVNLALQRSLASKA